MRNKHIAYILVAAAVAIFLFGNFLACNASIANSLACSVNYTVIALLALFVARYFYKKKGAQ